MQGFGDGVVTSGSKLASFLGLLALIGAGCGDDEPTLDPIRPEVPEVVPRERQAVQPPTAPTLPTLTPCAAGFREIAIDELAACEPIVRERACDRGMRVLGQSDCAPIDTCPAGEFADDLPSEGVVYVRAGTGEGDGSRARPFRTLAAAIAGRGSARVIAIGKGEHAVDQIVVPAGVTLRGACSDETVITSQASADFEGAIEVHASSVEIRGLSIEGAARPGLSISGGSATVREVAIRRAHVVGMLVENATAVIDRVLVEGTVPRYDIDGRGLEIAAHADVTVRRSTFEGNSVGAIVVTESALVLEDSVVGTTLGLRDTGGGGLLVQEAGRATVRRVLFDGNADVGAFAHEAHLDMADVVVRGTHRTTTRTYASGVLVRAGSAATIERTRLHDNEDVQLFALGEGTHASFSDILVHDSAVHPHDAASALGVGGRGLDIEGAEVDAARIVVTRAHEASYFIADRARVHLDDVVAIDTRDGRALAVEGGASLELARARFEDSGDAHVVIIGGDTTVVLEDLLAARTEPGLVNGGFGRGVNVQHGATLDARRVRIEDVHDIGLMTLAATSDVADLSVSGVSQVDCGEGCAPGGMGVASTESGRSTVRSFDVRGAATCGVFLADDGEADLETGSIAQSGIGACVQVDGYDVTRLDNGVEYVDNGANLDTTRLPVPTPLRNVPGLPM